MHNYWNGEVTDHVRFLAVVEQYCREGELGPNDPAQAVLLGSPVYVFKIGSPRCRARCMDADVLGRRLEFDKDTGSPKSGRSARLDPKDQLTTRKRSLVFLRGPGQRTVRRSFTFRDGFGADGLLGVMVPGRG
jgi:hypothetical protein